MYVLLLGSVRFEAAADDDTASVSSVSSSVSSVSSFVSSASEAFSFTDSESEKETDAPLSPLLKQKKGDKGDRIETDLEDIHFLGGLKKRRQNAAEGDTAVPLTTLRRQAAKRRKP